jgi:hypothetical protein
MMSIGMIKIPSARYSKNRIEINFDMMMLLPFTGSGISISVSLEK